MRQSRQAFFLLTVHTLQLNVRREAMIGNERNIRGRERDFSIYLFIVFTFRISEERNKWRKMKKRVINNKVISLFSTREKNFSGCAAEKCRLINHSVLLCLLCGSKFICFHDDDLIRFNFSRSLIFLDSLRKRL